MTAGMSAVNAFAADGAADAGGLAIDVDVPHILGNAAPFLNPAVKILCVVGGIKLGASFLKRAFH